MLIVCLGFVWPSHAGSAVPVSSHAPAQDHNVGHGVVSTSRDYLPMAFSKQLAQSASFDRFFATAHGIRLHQPDEQTPSLLADAASVVESLLDGSQSALPQSSPSKVSQTDLSVLFKMDQDDLTEAGHHFGHSHSNDNQHSNHSRSLDLAIAASSRFANLLRHDPEEIEPAYQLAIELPVEPVPSLAKGYQVDMLPSLDWMLNTTPSSGRISGWKESNLIYTVYHHRLPMA
ncbi:hypothetical protein [Photobacterium gaetbulicola]|uniref:hypothetical protein n=1 Tax=Photobacterium gaetbulicola TaxID=1295392 RepID=UPI0012E02DE7|nr:hypothetical protein [Photobacterium gaetbulicola]